MPVIVAGPADAARWASARLRALGAVVTEVTAPAVPVSPAGGAATVLADVTGGDPAWAPLLAVLRPGRAAVRLDPPPGGGRIVLVGGGPGDPGLQTVRARQELFAADVVLTDRLATYDDHALVQRLAPVARIIDVGKEPGHHRVRQSRTQEILIEQARAGRYVVRLKGGDPFVFGRGGEEVAAARAAGVPVTVVPGITSAIGVPEGAGIPVTHRSVSHAFTVIAGHVPLPPAECAALAQLGGTIVILMGVATLAGNAASLVAAGLDPATPFAVVERGSTPAERVIRGRIGEAAAVLAREGVTSPAVIVIGGVSDLPQLRSSQ